MDPAGLEPATRLCHSRMLPLYHEPSKRSARCYQHIWLLFILTYDYYCNVLTNPKLFLLLLVIIKYSAKRKEVMMMQAQHHQQKIPPEPAGPLIKAFYDAAQRAAKEFVPNPRFAAAFCGQVAHRALELAEKQQEQVNAAKAGYYVKQVLQLQT